MCCLFWWDRKYDRTGQDRTGQDRTGACPTPGAYPAPAPSPFHYLDFRRLIALFQSNRNICINNGEATNKLHNNIVFQEIDIFRIWIFRTWVLRRLIAILVRNNIIALAVERLQTGSTVAGLERKSGRGGGERGGSRRLGKLTGPGGCRDQQEGRGWGASKKSKGYK